MASGEDYSRVLNDVARMYQLDLSNPSLSMFKSSTNSPEEYHHSIFSGYTESGLSIVDGGISSSSANLSNVIVGQGIKNNHGIQLASISKIPNYSLGTKEDVNNSTHHISQKGKTILHGLGVSNDASSSGVTSLASNASLNQQLLKLSVVESKDQIPQTRAANGLPFYSKDFVTSTVKMLNKTSYVDDVEYLHGCVVLNQFLNSKRMLRDYQWKLYYNDRMGGKGIVSKLKETPNLKIVEQGGEAVIRENVPIESPDLHMMINRIPVERRSDAMLSSPGIIKSKIVTKRRKPTPNSLGHSNIRIRKPKYL
ncbi:unnamed protein product [Kuraishia capsulata CBS 1993]|uniref:Uncharacterized protein n=1 Tax=Kuraishia capsulata CBS 1993 TaxID=1382522 RepID=W6MXE1_9ASCO|nr:uncharacterized protein KUCA_T00004714001 [Kuraishia capsulata CBS 1993]CDK28730.1 unnamed protein product [Kuraishia capsulata CBS 1993]